jgi:hypothetical protein
MFDPWLGRYAKFNMLKNGTKQQLTIERYNPFEKRLKLYFRRFKKSFMA